MMEEEEGAMKETRWLVHDGAGDAGSSRWARDDGCVRRATTTIGCGRAAMEDDSYGVWRLRSVTTAEWVGAEEREGEIRVRFCVGKEMMMWQTLIGDLS